MENSSKVSGGRRRPFTSPTTSSFAATVDGEEPCATIAVAGDAGYLAPLVGGADRGVRRGLPECLGGIREAAESQLAEERSLVGTDPSYLYVEWHGAP